MLSLMMFTALLWIRSLCRELMVGRSHLIILLAVPTSLFFVRAVQEPYDFCDGLSENEFYNCRVKVDEQMVLNLEFVELTEKEKFLICLFYRVKDSDILMG